MDIFLIVLVSAYLALSVAGVSTMYRMRSIVQKALRRKVRSRSGDLGLARMILGWVIGFVVGATFSWPLIGIAVLAKEDSFMEAAFPVYLTEISKYNDFTKEEGALLIDLIKNKRT